MKRTAMRYTTLTIAFLSFTVLLAYTTIMNHYSSAFAQTNNITNQSAQQQNQSNGGDNPLSKVPVIGQLVGGGQNQSQQQGGNQSQNQSQQQGGNPLSKVPVIGELFGGGK
jgi:hypothetical protein